MVEVPLLEIEWLPGCLGPLLHSVSRKAHDLVLFRQPLAHQQFDGRHLCSLQMVPLELPMVEVPLPLASPC
jgi:hypothetical protein